MRMFLRVALLTAAFAVATAAFGWWTVPLLGAAWGVLVARDERPVRTAAVAAGMAWAILLAWGATQGPVYLLAQKVGPILQVPGWLFLGLTVIFPMALAGSAAEFGRWVGGVTKR